MAVFQTTVTDLELVAIKQAADKKNYILGYPAVEFIEYEDQAPDRTRVIIQASNENVLFSFAMNAGEILAALKVGRP